MTEGNWQGQSILVTPTEPTNRVNTEDQGTRFFSVGTGVTFPTIYSKEASNHNPFLFPSASQVALVLKNLPAKTGDIRDTGLIPGWGRPPGGGHGNPLQYSCQRIPWTEEPGRLQSVGSHRVGHDWSDLSCTSTPLALPRCCLLPPRTIFSGSPLRKCRLWPFLLLELPAICSVTPASAVCFLSYWLIEDNLELQGLLWKKQYPSNWILLTPLSFHSALKIPVVTWAWGSLLHQKPSRDLCLYPWLPVVSDSSRPHRLQPTRLSVGFSRQESWTGLPCPPAGDLPEAEFQPGSPALLVDSLPVELPRRPQRTQGPQNQPPQAKEADWK